MSSNYTGPELMHILTARQLKDGETVFAALPILPILVAKLTHAPNLRLFYENGYISRAFRRFIYSMGDTACADEAYAAGPLWLAYSDLQRGFADVVVLGAGQVDRFGNINSTAIFGAGDYYQPASRLAGSGGAADMGCLAGRTIIMTPLQRRRFVPHVDYVTVPGYLGGENCREEAGLNGGPAGVVTDKGIFRFHPQTREMYLAELAPGTTIAEVKEQIPWNLQIAKEVITAPPPTQEELSALRRLDPGGLILSGGKKVYDFWAWLKLINRQIH